MNRQQLFMHQALVEVQAIKDDAGVDVEQEKAIGRLCHAVPAWIMSNGLALTVAYLDAKRTGTNGATRNRFDHVYGFVTTVLAPTGGLRTHVANAPESQYVIDTLTMLDAWVYYKRFAVSILNAEPGEGDD